MKTTAKALTGLIALASSLAAASGRAGMLPGVAELVQGGMGLGQMPVAERGAADPRAEVADLLARARQAMAEGNLTAASFLISQAEGYRLQYGLFHNGDTPQKARRDLEALRREAGGSSSSGGLFGALGGPSAPSNDPFAAQNDRSEARPMLRHDPKARAQTFIAKAREQLAENNVVAATHWYRRAVQEGAAFGPHEDSPEKLAADIRRHGGNLGGGEADFASHASSAITPLPAVNQVNHIPPAPTHARRVIDDPATAYQTSAMPRGLETAAGGRSYRTAAASPYRSQSDQLLREARLALAYRDVDHASELIAQAARLRVPYGPHEDSPQKVEASMRRLQNLSARRPGTEIYRREYAEFLVEQSKALLAWGEYDEADRLAREAARQQVAYRPGDVKPEDLLEQIHLARRGERSMVDRGRSIDVTVPGPAPSMAAKQRAEELVRRARTMLNAGDLRGADRYAREAERLQIPDSQWGSREDRPGFVLYDIEIARQRAAGGVLPAGAESIGAVDGGTHASQAVYHPANDRTRNEWAGAYQPPGPGLGQVQLAQHTPAPAPQDYAPPEGPAPGLNPGMALYEQGKQALEAHDLERALEYFRQANQYRDQLDSITARQLQEKLQLLSANHRPQENVSPPEPIPGSGTPMSARQVYAEIVTEQNDAMRYMESDPKRCQAMLEDNRRRIEALNIDPNTKGQLVRRVDRQLDRVRRFIQENLARIEQEESNQRVHQEVDREQRVKLEIQQKLALMVDEYNRLVDEERFEEAELLARRADELDPENPVVKQLMLESKILRRYHINLALSDQKERGVWDALRAVDDASVPIDDMIPYQFGDPQQWHDLTRTRMRWLRETGRQRSDREVEIEQKLQTPVLLQFTDAPLAQVMTQLARLAQVNLYLDPHGLAEEGVMTDTPVTINLPQEISLKSALNLILDPLNLSYVVKDEVLKVTSVHLRDNETFTVTYPVADLVIPIPNFVPNPHMGMAGALRNALGDLGYAGMGVGGVSPMAVAMATKDGSSGSGMVNPALMAQMSAGPPAMGSGGIVPVGFGPGGLGGAAAADFESLEALITGTVQPDTWQEVGGPGTIDHLETNLSLVIRQTQEVHEEIVELLEQLRRLQDLQVTIEVRFITLNDNFYERIGVDFDFDIDDDIDRPFQVFGRTIDDGDPAAGDEPARNTLDTDHDNGSVTVGLSAPNIFSADLDIPFTQNSFGLAIPQFGGYDPAASATIGFAILSDIEAFFFIEAAQGDRRSNILQAPKVTLFNGQQAFVSDTSQSPFVISVIPVVGDFAAAQQPVIVVLSEGTFLTVQAVVSNDRRFVRLTVVPFFSEIGDVETFQFEGSETTSTDTSREGIQDEPNNRTKRSDSQTITRSGTTVQLPTFSFITVTTTVSVPDGGTVLLGGIKRLSEGRNEFGVPMLNKIPYVNRLFKNVGIGRETQSLMMMVTPRIIIQEEEEAKLGILTP